MGIKYNTSVVRSGLVLHLDAANVKSYPGSGTSWIDLSGNGNHGTLTNGPVFSSGVFSLDKINDFISVPALNKDIYTSFEMVFKTTSVSTNDTIRQYLYTQQRNPPTLATYTYQERQGFQIAGDKITFQYLNTDNLDNAVTTNAGTIQANTIYHIVIVLNNSVVTIYLNGVSMFLTHSKVNTTAKSIVVNQAFIGRRGDAQGDDYFGGYIYLLKDYNKALTENEVKQNFEALRGRYKI